MVLPLPDWEVYVTRTAALAVQEQSPARLEEIRNRVYELITHGIPTEVIFKVSLKSTYILYIEIQVNDTTL
jgi:replication factor C subunit 3/5